MLSCKSTLDPTIEASLRAEAKDYCPQQDQNACIDRYVDYATGDQPAALCTNGADRWYFQEQPSGAIGASCDGDTTIATIIGGD